MPLRGELGPRLIQCGLGRGLLPYQVGTVGAVPYPRRQCIFIGKDNPFPAIGDAGYRKHVGGAPSHGLRQHTHKIWCMLPEISSWTDRPTDKTNSSQYFATIPPGKVITVLLVSFRIHLNYCCKAKLHQCFVKKISSELAFILHAFKAIHPQLNTLSP